jgi:hypothetical protein
MKGDGKRNCLSNKSRPGQGAALIEFEQLRLIAFLYFSP